jgi:acyl-coenzyme A synthetase/AMP-(fatty) acid ligase
LRENWHNIDAVISATSLLSNDIANEAEKTLNTHVFEMYGCSESGAIATRHSGVVIRIFGSGVSNTIC